MPAVPPWDDVTAAFDAELKAWETYAVEIRAWAEGLRHRLASGDDPAAEHRRVIGDLAPETMLEQTTWVSESAERIAQRLREHLASGDIQAALLLALSPGPGARGFDYKAPGFWHGPLVPGDLRPMWTVANRGHQETLRSTLAPEAMPPWIAHSLYAWLRPIARRLWTGSYGLKTLTQAYAEHLDETGNPWAT